MRQSANTAPALASIPHAELLRRLDAEPTNPALTAEFWARKINALIADFRRKLEAVEPGSPQFWAIATPTPRPFNHGRN